MGKTWIFSSQCGPSQLVYCHQPPPLPPIHQPSQLITDRKTRFRLLSDEGIGVRTYRDKVRSCSPPRVEGRRLPPGGSHKIMWTFICGKRSRWAVRFIRLWISESHISLGFEKGGILLGCSGSGWTPAMSLVHYTHICQCSYLLCFNIYDAPGDCAGASREHRSKITGIGASWACLKTKKQHVSSFLRKVMLKWQRFQTIWINSAKDWTRFPFPHTVAHFVLVFRPVPDIAILGKFGYARS